MTGGVKRDLDRDKVAESILATRGNLSAVARQFRVERKTIYDFITAHPELQATVHDARETMLDVAEVALYDNVVGGKETSLIFFLKTQGYKRGYGRQAHYDPENPEAAGLTVILEDRRVDHGNTDPE